VDTFGAIEEAGAAGYGSVRIGLRAPRVAVRLNLAPDWLDWRYQFCFAMAKASAIWGGYGFIYIPYHNDKIHAAVARLLRAYDPDYLVDLRLTVDDVNAINPEWLERRGPRPGHDGVRRSPTAAWTLAGSNGTGN
jgi:hypothetical protein